MGHVVLAITLALATAAADAAPKEHPGRTLKIAGGVTFGVGVALLATSIGLIRPSNRRAHTYFTAASPSDTGFPSGRYADYRSLEGEIDRLDLAIRICAWTGAAALVTGTALLIAGAVRKRRARRDAQARVVWLATTLRF